MPGDAAGHSVSGPKPPAIQTFLKQALDWEAYLSANPGMTQVALARKLRMNRVRLTQILNLVRLAPEIQQYILAMPPTTAKRGAVTENRLRALVALQDHQLQIQKFRNLVGSPANSEAVA